MTPTVPAASLAAPLFGDGELPRLFLRWLAAPQIAHGRPA
jgi:hypothetical protein